MWKVKETKAWRNGYSSNYFHTAFSILGPKSFPWDTWVRLVPGTAVCRQLDIKERQRIPSKIKTLSKDLPHHFHEVFPLERISFRTLKCFAHTSVVIFTSWVYNYLAMCLYQTESFDKIATESTQHIPAICFVFSTDVCWMNRWTTYCSVVFQSQKAVHFINVTESQKSGHTHKTSVTHCCAVLDLVAQSCPTLCNPMGCSPPGSSVHGVLQARMLEWVAVLFSRGSSQPRDQTQVSRIAGGFFTPWVTREAQEYWSGQPFPSPVIFLTLGSNQGILHCREILYQGSRHMLGVFYT